MSVLVESATLVGKLDGSPVICEFAFFEPGASQACGPVLPASGLHNQPAPRRAPACSRRQPRAGPARAGATRPPRLPARGSPVIEYS